MISYVIPAHNEEHLIGATLAALLASARALGDPFEIIVVADACTDRTAEIAAAHGAQVVVVDRRQIAAVRNAGARTARGDLLVFVDADTIVPAPTLEAMRAALDAGAIGGGARVRMDAATPWWGRLGTWLFAAVYFGMGWAAGCFVFARRAAFEAAGGFDEQYFAGEELYLSRALKAHGRFVILREPVVSSGRKFRMHTLPSLLAPGLRYLVKGRKTIATRDGLDLWYDGRREGAGRE